MSFFKSINVSASGMTAERLRMDIISKNIANVNTTRTAAGTPYRRQLPIFREQSASSFETMLNQAQGRLTGGNGVEVASIEEDPSAFKRVYNPGHPDADEEGFVNMTNVDTVTEMINMISATRGYEANITALNASKTMVMKALDIGK